MDIYLPDETDAIPCDAAIWSAQAAKQPPGELALAVGIGCDGY